MPFSLSKGTTIMTRSRRPLANPSFRMFLAARSISILGDRFNELATPDALLGRVRLVPAQHGGRTFGVLMSGLLISTIGHRQALGVMVTLFLTGGLLLWRTPLARVSLRDLAPLEVTSSNPSTRPPLVIP